MGLIVDNFAGGGGASLGIELGADRHVDIAINHDAAAIEMHAANHPRTRHLTADVFDVRPRELVGGQAVDVAWFSPDCRHFSRAKGGKPVERKIRGLAWVAVRWAEQTRPTLIVLENVREFQDWGPLLPDNRPDPARRGLTFKQFTGRLRNLGYAVECRVLNAADYGAPTHRRRLFLIARCDGRPIVWPEPTHCDPKRAGEASLFSGPRKPWRTAAECIDWTIPCPSIFDRKKPLADKTLRRIAEGIRRYVLENPRPFIVKFRGDSPGHAIDQPLHTITGGAGAARPAGAAHAMGLVTPLVAHVTHSGQRRVHPADEPLPIVTGANRGELALIAPTLIQAGYGEREGQAPRVLDLGKPLGAAVGSGKHALVAAFITQYFGGMVGKQLSEPLPTTTGRGPHEGVAAACLIRMNHGEKQWNAADEPLGTVTSQGNKAGLVYAFLTSYFGNDKAGGRADAPLRTTTQKDRHGLVTIEVEGETYAIVDIGLRMLTPRELATAQGFPASYVLTGSKSNQVAKIGNSVCPPVAAAIVRANYAAAEPAEAVA